MNKAEYEEIIVESFVPEKISGHHGAVHIRPIKNQKYPINYFVSCSKGLSNTELHPLGTKFKIFVKLSKRDDGTPYLYSPPKRKYKVIAEN